MTTISFDYTSNYDFTSYFQEASRLGRYIYNRIKEGLSEKEIRHHLKEEFSNLKLSAWIQTSIIKDMVAVNEASPNTNIIFGGKKNFIDRIKNKISNEEWKHHRLRRGLIIQGEVNTKGNRHFELHIDEGYVVLKLNRKEHIRLDIKGLGKKWRSELLKLQSLNEVKNKEQGYTYTIRVTFDKVFISFEEFKQPIKNLKENTYAGIDLNPSNIGFSICRDKEVKVAKEFSIKSIIDEVLNSKLASDSPKMKYLQKKISYETFEIAKNIVSQCLHNQVKFLFIEDLNFKDATKGRRFNRITKNLWKRNKFIDNLKKRCNEVGIKVFFVKPQYSSFIGNVMHDYSDPVNASLEIARRGYECIILKNKMFFPKLFKEALKHQWKETLSEEIKDWKGFYRKIKNLNMRVRVLLKDTVHEEFKMSSYKSRVKRFVFT